MELFIFDLQKETKQGGIRGMGGLGCKPTPSLGSLKPELINGNKTVTEAIFSRIVPISSCLVSPPPPSKILDPPPR